MCWQMGTSYGRFKLFGDCRVAHWPGSNWTCIVDDCVVTGLYLDNFDLGAYRDNFALGTTSLPRPSNAYWPRFVPIIPGGDMPGVIHRVAWDTPVFLTTASLRGVVFLAACGGAGRCSGLVLRYWSGRTEVLGAANARGQDTASVIYNAMRDGPLRCLLFTHDEQDSVRRIRAVKVVKDDDDEVDPGESEVVCREVCPRLGCFHCPLLTVCVECRLVGCWVVGCSRRVEWVVASRAGEDASRRRGWEDRRHPIMIHGTISTRPLLS